MRKRSEVVAARVGPPLAEVSNEPEAPKTVAEAFVTVVPDGKPRMSDEFERILTRVLDLPNAEAEYDRLEKALRVGAQRNDLGTLMEALDQAEDNARVADKIAVNAQVERDACLKEFEVFQAPIWSACSLYLQEQKDSGVLKSKNITDARAACAQRYPDEYRDFARREATLDAMVQHTKKLAALWSSRCASLMTMIANRRK
jgi:hypothetical protein